MRWLSGKGVCCQAGKPEFDPQHPHARRQNSSASCPLSPTCIPCHGHVQRRKRRGEGRREGEKRKTEGIKTCICTEMLGTVKALWHKAGTTREKGEGCWKCFLSWRGWHYFTVFFCQNSSTWIFRWVHFTSWSFKLYYVKNSSFCLVWWCMPTILVLGRLGQRSKSSKLDWTTYQDPASEEKKKKDPPFPYFCNQLVGVDLTSIFGKHIRFWFEGLWDYQDQKEIISLTQYAFTDPRSEKPTLSILTLHTSFCIDVQCPQAYTENGS